MLLGIRDLGSGITAMASKWKSSIKTRSFFLDHCIFFFFFGGGGGGRGSEIQKKRA